MLKFARLITGSTFSKLTFFHNSNSKLSHHLLERLAIHGTRYSLDIRTNRLPSYETYSFIHEECMNVHPQNNHSFEQIFPALLASSSHSFCDAKVKNKLKVKQYVPDSQLVDKLSYQYKLAQHAATELSPFIVDWENKLVAIDDEGLDVIMQNYYSCDMQKSSKVHLSDGSDLICQNPGSGIGFDSGSKFFSRPASYGTQRSPQFTQSTAAATSARFTVHPHVAEFADLY